MRIRERHHVKVSAVARAFVLASLFGPALWNQDTAGLIALVTIGAVWSLSTLADWRQRLPVSLVTTVEAVVVGAVCAFTLSDTLGVLGALAVPPFTAGLYRGIQGVALALSAQMSALVVVAYVAFDGFTPNEGFGAFSWNMTGLGLGLVGVFLHSALNGRSDPLAPYHYAQGLIRQLIDLSGGLDNGLDPVALGGSILSAVRDDLPTSAVVVSVPRGDTLTPLVSKALGTSDDVSECEDIAVEAWAVGLPVLHDRVFAFPLNTDAGTVAIVAGILSDRVDSARIGVEDRIRKLMRRLAPSAVHLDTALLFAAFRDAATAEERRRLAREMHDGVAQDIASLGYLVDALGAGANSPDQTERLEMLRERISSIVAEIRRSVVNLRTSVGQSESLGTAIGSIARNLSGSLRRTHPRHLGRAHATAATRGRGGAVPDRAGGDEQRRAARPGLGHRRALPGACAPGPDHRDRQRPWPAGGPPDLARAAHHARTSAAHQRLPGDRRDRGRRSVGLGPGPRDPHQGSQGFRTDPCQARGLTPMTP